MQTKLSSKGQVVLPVSIRHKLQLKPGDPFEARVEKNRIVLIPKKSQKRKGRIICDPVTGLPALTFGPGAPKITGFMVEKLLEDFP